MTHSIALIYGAILFGGAVALLLSGVVAVQCIIFFHLYPDEARVKTAMVASVWALDVTHSVLILVSLFHYFVAHFGNKAVLLAIPWPIALTILLTAMQTCVVHLFYAYKIYRSSGKNWWITAPIALLACLRLASAIVSTEEMLRLGHWAAFTTRYSYHWFLFTTGLFLSALTDCVITLCLCYYLRKIRRLSTSNVMKGVMDTLTLYTLENGLITCLATIASLTFWLRLPNSFIALSLHFVIGKLYPNSLLVLLNTRKELREMHSGDQGIHFDPVHHLDTYYRDFPHRAPVTHARRPLDTQMPTYAPAFRMHQVEVRVERSVRRHSISSFDSEKQMPQRSLRSGSEMHWSVLP